MAIDYEKKINVIIENLDKAKNLKIRAETKLEQLNKQREESIKELEELGVKPDELDTEIDKLKNEIEFLLDKVEKMIPSDLIK